MICPFSEWLILFSESAKRKMAAILLMTAILIFSGISWLFLFTHQHILELTFADYKSTGTEDIKFN